MLFTSQLSQVMLLLGLLDCLRIHQWHPLKEGRGYLGGEGGGVLGMKAGVLGRGGGGVLKWPSYHAPSIWILILITLLFLLRKFGLAFALGLC